MPFIFGVAGAVPAAPVVSSLLRVLPVPLERALPVAIAVLLAGCVPASFWIKDGVSLARYQRDQTGCEVTGTQQVPTNTQFGWAPYTGIYSADTNTALRQRVIAQCMTDRGYRRVELPACPGDTASAVRSGDLPRRPSMKITSESCHVAMMDGSYRLYTP